MNNTGFVSTQLVLTSNFVKYTRLRELVNHMFAGSQATNLNIFIDVYGAMKTLFSDSYRTDIKDYTAFTSTLINMCGHYRSFFKTIGVSTKIYIIFSYNICDINCKLTSGYNGVFLGKFSNKVIYDMVELNNNLLEVLCPFLPDIFFLKTSFESSVLIDYLISIGDGNPNLIISKDIYPAQLTELHPYTAFIKPKKSYNEDISFCISPRENINHINDFKILYCCGRGTNTHTSLNTITIHPINFNILSAMSRFPERNLKSLYNISIANKIIFGVVRDEAVKVTADSINQFTPLNVPVQIIDGRYKSLDVEFMRQAFIESIESKMIHLENLNDVASVNAICAEYFKDNPIDLTRL